MYKILLESDMNFNEVAKNLTPQTYQALKQAVEIGKWPTGVALTNEQRSLCLEAIITYEHAQLPQQQQTGYMPDSCQSKDATETITLVDQS